MSSVGIHDFSVPHEFVQPTRDMVIVRLPLPPKMVGGLELPQTFRDMAVHNVMVGRIVAMGPLAFTYKDADGLQKQQVGIGDWVAFRPFAGTQMVGGKLAGSSNWRYMSSFQDVIGIIPADKMPDPDTLLWEDTGKPDTAPKSKQDDVPDNVRERVRL